MGSKGTEAAELKLYVDLLFFFCVDLPVNLSCRFVPAVHHMHRGATGSTPPRKGAAGILIQLPAGNRFGVAKKINRIPRSTISHILLLV